MLFLCCPFIEILMPCVSKHLFTVLFTIPHPATTFSLIVSSHILPCCHKPQTFPPFLIPALFISLSYSFCLVPTSSDIKEHVKQIEKAVSGKEPRFVLRALRALPSTSRRLNANVLHKALAGFYTSNATARDYLLGFLEEVGSGRRGTAACELKGRDTPGLS